MCEYDGADSLLAVNTFGAAGLLSRRPTSTNATILCTFDDCGDVAERCNSNRKIQSADAYDAFGRRTSTVPVQPDPWGFGAQASCYTDIDTGLVLCTHRFYDPQQGRFLTRDPLGYGEGHQPLQLHRQQPRQ